MFEIIYYTLLFAFLALLLGAAFIDGRKLDRLEKEANERGETLVQRDF